MTKRYYLDGNPAAEFHTIWGAIEEAVRTVKYEPASIQYLKLVATKQVVGFVSNKDGGVLIDVDEVQFD